MPPPAPPRPPATLFTLSHHLVRPTVDVRARAATDALSALDEALRVAQNGARDPMLRQIRLRWWSDQLEQLRPGDRPPDPTLARVARDLIARFDRESRARLSQWAANHDDPAARGEGLFAIGAHLLGGAEGRAEGGLWGQTAAALEEGAAPRLFPPLEARAATRGLAPPLRIMAAQARDVARRGGRNAPLRDQWISLRVGLLGR